MAWVTDSGLHEGYLVPQFADGQRGLGTTGAGIPDDHVAVDVTYNDEGRPDYKLRPSGEVTGWVVCCNCSTPTSFGPPSTWTGPVFTRVPSPALENVREQRVYATDADVAYVSDRDDVEEAAQQLWRLEHAFTTDAVEEIEAATGDLTRAQRRLETAVHLARHSGSSWEAIGRAAGMSRQSAHERWRHLDAPTATD